MRDVDLSAWSPTRPCIVSTSVPLRADTPSNRRASTIGKLSGTTREARTAAATRLVRSVLKPPRDHRGTHFVAASAGAGDTATYLRGSSSGGGTRTHNLRINRTACAYAVVRSHTPTLCFPCQKSSIVRRRPPRARSPSDTTPARPSTTDQGKTSGLDRCRALPHVEVLPALLVREASGDALAGKVTEVVDRKSVV